MSDSLTVGLQYRKNDLSLTAGGSVVAIERGDGIRLEYPNIKYPSAYANKVVAKQLAMDLDEVHQLAFKPEYREEIKKMVRRIWVDGTLYWEQEDPNIPWLERGGHRSLAPKVSQAQQRHALASILGDL